MQLQLQEQEAERAARNQKMSELGFYYQYDPVGMAERAENIFNIENPDINSPDANTARRALNNELTKYYEKYGDIIIRPQSQALNDILAQAKADGTSLSAALKKNFTDQLQSKSLYGQMLGKNIGIDM
jgi:lambda repressor-like predicted transcriptional regulator